MAKAYLEANEVEALEKSATNLRDRLLIRLLFHLGCRISEALGVTVEDVDLVKGSVTIQHLKMRMKLSCPHCAARLSKSHTYCPRCGAIVEEVVAEEKEHRRVRTLPIDDDTLVILKDYILRGGPVCQKGKILIFGINRHRAWQVVKECAERAGLPDLVNPETGKVHGVSPHRLRDATPLTGLRVYHVPYAGSSSAILYYVLGVNATNLEDKSFRAIPVDKVHKPFHRSLFQGNSSNPVYFLLFSQRFRNFFTTTRAEFCYSGQPGVAVRAKKLDSSLEMLNSDCALDRVYIIHFNSQDF